jgi:hypothetical protein
VRRLLPILLLSLTSAASGFAQGDAPASAPSAPADPDNRHMHATRFSIAPDQQFTLPRLEHESIVVSLTAGRLDRRPTVGQPETLDLVPGRTFAVRGSSTDLLTNLSPAPIDLLLLELKDSYAFNEVSVPRSAKDPLDMDPHHIRLEMENENVRVLRVHLKPREGTEESQFGMRLELPLTDSLARQIFVDGKTSEATFTAGRLSWHDSRMKSIINSGDSPLDLLMVEFKHPFCYFVPQHEGPGTDDQDDQDEAANAYLTGVNEKLRRTWNKRMPREVLEGEPGYVAVNLKISNDGTLPEDGISLSAVFADEVMVGKILSAVRDASPFPPFPSGVNKPELTMRYVVLYNLSKNSTPGCP